MPQLDDHTLAVISDLGRDRVTALERSSTAERVADAVRTRIMEGLFPPGARLPEELISTGLGVSRNTVREAFRLLCHERLAIHELNRGVSVPVPSADDVVDLYLVRQVIEVSAAGMVGAAPKSALRSVRAAAEAGRRAAVAERWREVATADLEFHRAIANLAESERVDEIMRRTLAELRLLFHLMSDPERFHAPYIERNDTIARLLEMRDGPAAQRELTSYLSDAKEQILTAYQVRGDKRSQHGLTDGRKSGTWSSARNRAELLAVASSAHPDRT
jgi:DNA-binding GntR family transcriptional regulator